MTKTILRDTTTVKSFDNAEAALNWFLLCCEAAKGEVVLEKLASASVWKVYW